MHLELDTVLSLKPTTLNFILLSSHFLVFLNIIFITQSELHVQLIVNLQYFYISKHIHYSVLRCAIWWASHLLIPLRLKQFITHRVFRLLQYTFFPLEYDTTKNCKIPRCRLLTVLFPVICGRCTRLTLRLCRITKAAVVAAITLSKVNGCTLTSLSVWDACDVLWLFTSD